MRQEFHRMLIVKGIQTLEHELTKLMTASECP
jgi:hypothetical protein